MRKVRLFRQIFPSYLIIILFSLIAVGWYSAVSLRDFHIESTTRGLEARAHLLAHQFASLVADSDTAEIDRLCKELGKKSSTRITVILPDGTVVGDTEKTPEQMENHINRPEIKSALNGRVENIVRRSPTLQRNMMYIAIPLELDGAIIGVVRTSVPLVSIYRAMGHTYIRIIIGGLIIAILAVLLSLLISRRLSAPLEEMRHTAQAYAAGDFSARPPFSQTEEIASLADSMRIMAGQLDERIRTITMQRNEMEAILSSMVEGVFAIDREEHIISINKAAVRMLDIKAENIQGRSIPETIRNNDFQKFVTRAMQAEGSIEGEIILRPKTGRYIQVHGTALMDRGGTQLGAVIVLNDITRIRRLENLRRDFVANVSHELKTPLTSIKGYVETLQEMSGDFPENAGRFLAVIVKQTDRINRIVEDLLLLSRIEQDKGSTSIKIERVPLRKVLESAIDYCGGFSEKKGIEIELQCSEDIIADINTPLLETAVVNLIDNAVKYSDEGSRVSINVTTSDNEIIISVRDNGIGIAAEHQPRLFERFYRVDKGRSREMGGTGLGLSIVKHIAETHKGRVSVESAIGEGCVFNIHLPGIALVSSGN